MAMMAPQITGVMNGLNIWKHQTIIRDRTPIRIAMSIANCMYDFSWVILSGWFMMFLLLDATRLLSSFLAYFVSNVIYRKRTAIVLFSRKRELHAFKAELVVDYQVYD